MREKIELWLLGSITAVYLVMFSVVAFLNQNYEFLYYTAIMITLLLLAIKYNEKVKLPFHLLGGLVIVGLLHIAGGTFKLWGTRLYDIWLINGLLKYDNFIHIAAIFVTALITYNILFPMVNKKLRDNKLFLYFIITMIAFGIGALNEVLELAAVVFFGAANGVGGYINNALDLLFDLVGAVLGCVYIIYRQAEEVPLSYQSIQENS